MKHVIALSGGIGGAKLAVGLDQVLESGRLTVVANPGDDFEHLGLSICPDLDTLMYTLAGVIDPERGWGLAGETWRCMDALDALGGETWFRLGDADLATHLERTRRLAAGEGLASIALDLAARLGIGATLWPATEDPVRTVLDTDRGTLAFQHYFVREQCAPVVTAVRYEGAERARPLPALLDALASPETGLVIICPSNPYLSLDPMLAMPALRSALAACTAPVIAVSPVIGGESVKGPTAKMMRELGKAVSVRTVAEHYAGLIDGFVIDSVDAGLADDLGVRCLVTDVLMRDVDDKRRLAAEVVAFGSGQSP